MVPQLIHSSLLRICFNVRWLTVILVLLSFTIVSWSFPSSYRESLYGQRAIKRLLLEQPIEAELGGSDPDLYEIALQAGQCARIQIQRRGIDVLVNFPSRSEPNSTEYENPAGPQSPMSLWIIATTAGNYKIEVRPVEKWLTPGHYTIVLEDVHAVVREDEIRVNAQREVAKGRRSQLLDTDASRLVALDSYNKALSLWRELGDVVEQANTLHFIAQTYRSSSIEENYVAVLTLRGEVDKNANGYTLLDMGGAYSNGSKFDAALTRYGQAFKLFEASDNRRGQAAALYGKGLTKARQGNMTEALNDYQQALAIYARHETRDRHEEGRTLHAMGGAHDVLGNPEEARKYFDQALEAWRDTGDPGQEGNTYSSLAKLEMDRGNWQAALDTSDKAFELYKLGEAASIREKPALRRRRASSLYNLAYTYASLADYPKAFELLEESMALREPGAKGSTFMLTCYFQALSGEPEKALRTCDAGIAEQQQGSGNSRISETYTAKGAAYAMLGKHKEAIELYDKALAIQTDPKSPSPQAEAISQGWRGESFNALGEHEKALASYDRSRALWQQYKELNGMATAMIGMAQVERDRNNLPAALDRVTRAIAAIEPLRTNVTDEQLRTKYFATKVDYYELYIDLSMQLADKNNDARLVAAAFDASERAHARSLIETLATARFEDVLQAEPKLAELVHRYFYLKGEIKVLRSSAGNEVERQKQAQVEVQQNQLESQIRANYPQYAALMFPQPLKAAEVQKLLDADTLLLEFALGEDRSYLWAVTNTELQGYKLPARSEIEGTAEHLMKRLAAGQRRMGETASQYATRTTGELNEYLPQAAAFSRLLLGQVPALAQKKHVVIVADGRLQYFPFAALPAPDSVSNGTTVSLNAVLIRDHEITNLPSASVLALLRQTAGRARGSKSIAVFADPVLERDDSRLQTAQRTKTTKLTAAKHVDLAQALRNVDGDNAVELPRLQLSGLEARQIINLAGRSASLAQIGFDANRANATSRELRDYRVVHFATHGILDEITPQLSGVVLSLYDKQGRYHPDGYLRLADIYGLNLPVELVVLSACRTGLGKRVRGEGLIGLARGFMYAGAQRVLASVWKVDDEATAELMKRFYQNMLKERMTPAAALRTAQWSMSNESRWSHPYYWAGFILQGESK